MVFAPLLTMASWLKAKQTHHYDSDAQTSNSVTMAGAGQANLAIPLLSMPNLGRIEGVKAKNGDRYLPIVTNSSMSTQNQNDPEQLYGIVTIAIHPNRNGQIKFKGGWWSAKCGQSIVIDQGTLVTILGRDNITLVVEPFGPRTDAHDQEKLTGE